MTKRRSPKTAHPSAPVIEELEPRVLFSADAAVLEDGAVASTAIVERRVIETPPDSASSNITEQEPSVETIDFNDINDLDSRTLPNDDSDAELLLFEVDETGELTEQSPTRELIVVDTQIEGYQQLVDNLTGSNVSNDRDFEILLILRGEDGLARLSQTLESQHNLDAVHILSHGQRGGITLGSSQLNLASLPLYSEQLETWEQALSPDADLLIYGCNLAASDSGTALIDRLSSLTQADVAASDDLTGNASAGGDWKLEYLSGAIEASTLAPAAAESGWEGVLAAALTPTGEIQVNTTTGGTQETSAQTLGSKDAVAMDSAGNYVVVWSDSVTDGSGYGIFGQRFDATGAKQGAEFQINQTTTDNQYWASVAMADDGRFAVTWTSVNQDGTPASVYARQFNADGSAFGNEFRVNSTTSGSQTNASVAMVRTGVNAGDFVIVWQGNGSSDSDGIYGQRYAADGSAVGSEFFANNTITGLQENPAVAINDNGEFSVVWEDAENIFLEFFDNTGFSQNLQAQVNTGSSILFTVDNSISPDLVLANDGTSSVVWRSENSVADGVYLRQVDKNGNLLGFSATSISTSGNPDSTSPSIARDTAGNLLISYHKTGDGSSTGIYARAFDASLSPLTDEFLINQTTSGTQQYASVGLLDIDNFVIVWSGNGGSDADGIFTRQYSYPHQITVNTTNDTLDGDTSSFANLKLDPGADGVVSLREAITAANGDTNSLDTVLFDIPGVGPHVITPGSALPTITDSIVIDGSSEPDYSNTPVVEINGAAAGDVSGLILDNNADNSVIKGLSFTGFTGAANGIAISLNSADDVTLQGNYIGVKPDGSTVAGNRIGIDIGNNADRNIVGSINTGAGNLIRGNTDGLIIADTSSTRNTIRGNAIYGNVESNFALSNTDTVTPNDADDSDTGPNNLQNYPVLSAASISGNDLTVTGSLTSSANTALTLDFYVGTASASPSGYPEAERYLGSSSTTTGDNGDGSGSAALNELISSANVANGEYITVIAIDGNGNSSEMALSIAATGGNSAPTTSIAALAIINEGGSLSLDASGSTDPDSDPLSYRWDLNNDGTYGDVTGVNPTVDWATLTAFGIDDDGSYTIGLQVDDGRGGTDTTTAMLTVNNVAPTLSVSGAAGVFSGDIYTLNLAATDPGNDTISSWTINWGDGNIETVNGNPSSATHVYANTGFTNNIVVSATDEDITENYIHSDLFAGRYVNNAGIYRIQGSWGNAPVLFATEGTLDKAIQPIIGPDGNIYVSGESSNNILRYDAATGAFMDIFATTGAGEAQGIAFGPDGNLYVANGTGREIMRFDGSDGTALPTFVANTGGNPYSLTFGPDGNLYVNLYNSGEVHKYDGSTGASLGTFVASTDVGTPEQMVFGPDGNLYIADVANNSVLQFNGSDGSYIKDFIPATEANLDSPNGLAFGPDGSLYVSDAQDGDILRYNGSTGTFIDVYASGLNTPSLLGFAPDLQVSVLEPRQVAVAADSSGNYVIVEESYTGTDIDLVAQRYDASGNPVGGTININTTSANNQFDPDVAMDANGNFVVVWSSEDGSGDTNVVYRVFNNTGSPLTSELLANTTTSGSQQFASVAYGGDGNFIITWSSQGQDDGGDPNGWGVYARRFDGTTGAAIDTNGSTDEFLVNATTTGDQKFSDVAADDYGDFIIAWQSDGQDGDGWGIYDKVWRESGALLHDEILRNTSTVGDQQSVTVGMEGDGDYTLAWVSDGQDGDAGGIYADNVAWGGSGTNTAGEFRISSTTAGDQDDPEIANDPTGNFIVTWTSTGQDGDAATETNVYGQIYNMQNSGPVIVGSEFLVNNSYTTGIQGHPAVAAAANGNVISAWSGETAASTYGVSHKILTNALQNEVPVIKLANAAISYTEGDAPLAIDTALTITDADSTHLAGATVSFRDGFAAGEDQLNFSDQLGITGSYVTATGILTLSGSATITDYQTALRTVTYSNSSYTPSTTQRIVEVKVDDGTASSSDTRKLNVSATNTAPIIDNLAPSIAENTTSLTITATDPEGDAITGYSISGGADAARFSLDGATGVLTFNTAPDYESPADANGDNVYEVEITTTDGLGATLAQLVSISVTNVNEAPTANNSTVTTDEDSEYTFTTADFNFSDIDGDALSSVKITTLEHTGSLELNGSAVTLNQVISAADITAGNLKFVPVPNANGIGYDNFDFSVNDGTNDSTASYTMTLNVTPINDTPVIATNSGVTIAEGSTGTVITTAMLNEGDVDDTGTGLTYTVTSPVSNGTLKLNGTALAMNDSFSQADIDGGRVSYDHDGSQTASDSFSFTLADGGEDGAVAVTVTFNISVTNVNDAPVNTVPGTQSVNEDTALAIGGISIADDDNNLSTVQLTVSSGTLNVALAGSASISAGANGSADLTLSGSLVDINTTLGTLTYQGNAHFNGSDTLTVLSTDASGATDSDTVAITVNPVNDSPVNTVPASVAVTEDAATALKGISIADVDSGNSTILLTLSVPSGTLTASSGGGVTVGGTTTDLMLYGTVVEINNFIAASNVAYTSATNANGSVALTVLTSDQGNTGSGGALTDSDSVSLVISAVNDAPTATNLSAAETYVEDTSLNLTDIVSTDVDSNVTVTLVLSDTAAGSLNSGTAGAVTSTYNAGTGIWVASGAVADVNALLAALTFTPALNYDSNFAMATSVSDGVNPAVTGTKSFTGTPVDDLPLLTSPANFTVSENSQTVTTLTATDIDSPANMRGFSITGGADAALFTLDADTGVMSFINAPDHETPADANGDNVYEIQVTVDDGQGGQSTGSLRVTISNVDEPPHLVNANSPGSYTEDTPLSLGDIQIQDVDGGTATLTITLSDPAAGFLTDDPGSLGSLGISDANGQWTALGSIEQINAALANLVFIPGADQNADVTLSIRLDDGITTVDLGEKLIVGIPVADTPQVSGTSTGRDTLTAPISITPNPNDGDEVTYFQISQIKQGSLFLADGTTPLKEGDFISRQQAEQGVRFLPAPDATGNGSFTVQASLDGVGVSPGSTPASASIVVSTPVPISPELPPEPVQADPSPEPISGSTPPTQLPVSEDNSPAESPVFVEPPREQNMADGQAAESDKTVAVPIQKNLSSAEAKESGERTRLELSGIQTRTSSAATAQLLNLMLDEVNLSQHQITVSSYQNLYDSLETIRREQSLDKLAESRIIGTAATVSSGLTMGYVVWMIRGGMLASSVMVSLPAWQIADPLPILGGGKTADEDDESLESIIENSKSKTSPPLQHSDQEQEPVA